MTQTNHIEARSMMGRPLATFDTLDKAHAFRAAKAERDVGVRLFEVTRTEKELTDDVC